MLVAAVLISVLIIALLAGSDLFLAELNADELSSMGIERES